MESLYPLLFGLIGTALMTIVLYVVAQAGATALAGVRGIGSSIPTQLGSSLVPGAVVFIVVGIVFGYVYQWLGLSWADLNVGSLLLLGAGVGIVRGIVVSAVLGMIAFDQRPLERMAQAGGAVGTAHVIGSVLYGLALSVLFGLTRVESALAF